MTDEGSATGLGASFIAHLEDGGSIVTATRRQARLIRALFDRNQLARGRRAWPTAEIAPFFAWGAARWADASSVSGSLPLLLAEDQALWPWRAHASLAGDSLVDSRELASAARRAWIALRLHEGCLEDIESAWATRDQRRFGTWAQRVEHDLEAAGWLDPGCLELALAAHADLLGDGPQLLLAGFRQPAPALRRLADALADRGREARFAPVASRPGRCMTHVATDPDHEIESILTWLRHRLAARPEGRFAVFIPDLAARRAAIERAFESLLQPELELPGSSGRDRLFDFAGGVALAGWRVVDSALVCLEAGAPRLDIALASRLLRSPYVGRREETESRVRLDVALRAAGVASRSLRALGRAAGEGGCAAFGESLAAAAGALRSPGVRAGPDVWASAFGEALASWGWPGSGSLASDEYQAAEALRERLGDLAGLARVAPPMSRNEALSELSRLCQAPFQPGRAEPAVLVYDTLEAPGIDFDGLWVSGMTAAEWPRATSPDPFLPLPLQSALGMPGARAADMLEEASAVTAAWAGSAPEVVFSWPRRKDDATVEASRILPAGLAALALPSPVATRARASFEARARVLRPDEPAPAVRPADARGGSRILDLQAKCPFRAFAVLRLGAEPLEEPSAGVDARTRGLILHRTLELLAGRLPGSGPLREATPAEIELAIGKAVDQALDKHLPEDIGDALRRQERAWQSSAASRFVELERERGPFEVVGTEQELETQLAGLPLKLRVDRVDCVPGGLVVIDYKTGRASPTQWRGARPDAPQLPLYAVLRGPEVCGVAFAAVGARRARFRGIASEPDLLPGVGGAESFALTEQEEKGFDWQQVRARWTAWLSALARGFLEGRSEVDPKRPQTCRNCHLGTFCRVSAPADAAAEAPDDE